MAQVDSQPAADLALQPSPVLLEAVQKVEQVVARLQNLQSTISGIQLSPVNPRHIRASRANATTRALNSKENTDPTQRRDEYKRKSLKYHNVDSNIVQPDQSLKTKDWKQWSSPANQVHDVISEILMASEFAKQIATLVAEALQDKPQKTQEPPADQIQEPKKKLPKDGKRRDIAFPSKAQVQKTMSAKAPPSKTVNKFKLAFPSDSAAKLILPAKLSRPKDPPSKTKCGPGSPHRRRISRANWSNSSSPNSLSPRFPRMVEHSPEMKREKHKLFSSPSGSFRESGDADDELAGPRRHSMNVTEIKASVKPWKLTPTKGVLFSNPVYLEASPPKSSPARPSPVRIVPTTGTRRRSWLTHQFPKSQARCSSEADRKLRSSASGNSMASSVSKVTFKREGPTKPASKVVVGTVSSKREQKARKMAPPSRYVEMVPLDGPQDNSLVTMLDVLTVRSPSRHPMSRLGANDCTNTAMTQRKEEIVEDQDECRASHSHTKCTPDVEKVAKSKQGGSVHLLSDKENTPLPSCARNAAKFLRSISNGHALNRTLSRKNSAVSLLQRAKGWMSSQVVKQGRVRELER